MGCWHCYMSGARCRLAYGPADTTAVEIGFTFLVLAHLGSPGKGPLNGFVCVCVMLLTFILIIISIPSPPHCFIPGLNLPFLQILFIIAFLFFRTDYTDSQDCLLILLSWVHVSRARSVERRQ